MYRYVNEGYNALVNSIILQIYRFFTIYSVWKNHQNLRITLRSILNIGPDQNYKRIKIMSGIFTN